MYYIVEFQDTDTDFTPYIAYDNRAEAEQYCRDHNGKAGSVGRDYAEYQVVESETLPEGFGKKAWQP